MLFPILLAEPIVIVGSIPCPTVQTSDGPRVICDGGRKERYRIPPNLRPSQTPAPPPHTCTAEAMKRGEVVVCDGHGEEWNSRFRIPKPEAGEPKH
jgi:hypothetical protein